MRELMVRRARSDWRMLMKLKRTTLYGFVMLTLASGGISAAPPLPMVKLSAMPDTVTEGDPVRFDFRLSRPAPPTELNVRLTLST